MMISIFALAQSPKAQKVKYISIKQKGYLHQRGFQLILKTIITDSRCPEGVTCIWAGEVTAVVSVYKDSKWIEDRTLVFSLKNEEDNKKWFAGYMSKKHRNIKSIVVLPYPKEISKINPEKYYLKIGVLK